MNTPVVDVPSAARFERPMRIRFSHCDPAGIVFFPQYLVLFNALVEDWFTDELGVPYADLLGPRRIGLPIVHLKCDFRAICRMGDNVTLALVPVRVGHRSLTLSLSCRMGDVVCVESQQVLVFTSLETHRAIEMPEDVRQALASVAA